MFMILIAAMIMMVLTGCFKDENATNTPAQNNTQATASPFPTDTPAPTDIPASTDTPDPTDSPDETAVRFTLVVVDRDGTETSFDITTDKETVGEALMDENLIEGDEGEYGLYIKKVNGIEAVYENDGTYWSFYINGEYAMTGVDSTKAESGMTYMLKVGS